MNGKVRLYGSLGKLRYETGSGTIEDGKKDERIYNMLQRGLRVLFDRSDRRIMYFIKLSYPQEQLLVDYTWEKGEDPEPLSSLDEVLKELGWELSKSEFYYSYRSEPLFEFYNGEKKEAVLKLTEKGEKLEFVSSSLEESPRILKWFVENTESDVSIAICTGGRIEELSDVDVVITPQLSDTKSVGPSKETDTKVEEQVEGVFIDKLKNAISKSQLNPSQTLSSAGIREKLGLVAKNKTQHSGEMVEIAKRASILSIAIGVVVAISLFWLVWTPSWVIFAELNYSEANASYENGSLSASIYVENEGSTEAKYSIAMKFNNKTTDKHMDSMKPGDREQVRLSSTVEKVPQLILIQDERGAINKTINVTSVGQNKTNSLTNNGTRDKIMNGSQNVTDSEESGRVTQDGNETRNGHNNSE